MSGERRRKHQKKKKGGGGRMGEIEAGTMTKKKKKKGRPSLLDLQKRSLKQQQQQQQTPNLKNPNSLNHRNPNSSVPDLINDEDDERTQKKHKLLLGLNNSEVALKRRKITPGSDQLGEKALKATDTLQESPVEPGPTTPLPDKKLLVFILDRLQKKDTYGVFSDPVDPEELPDYHDIVEHPMDFSTVRKKLDRGAYFNLEQFEKDVFLICSNAMQYNPSDTIYYRQARSIQELAKKDFENLRQDSDDGEPQPNVARRGRPPGKLKKSLERSPLDRVSPDCSSDATHAFGGDNTNETNGYNLRRTNSYKYRPADVLVRTSHGSHSSETYAAWMSEWENEFPASVLKAVLKYGKKPYAVDENRRDTYKQPLASTPEPSSLNFFEGELKQLVAVCKKVGLNSEYGYARSLARFAADLGPVVWKIASKKIESALPTGLEFGPGWVGEDKVVDGQQKFQFSDRPKVSNSSIFNDHFSRPQPTATGTNSAVTSICSARTREDWMENVGKISSQSELISTNSSTGGINYMSSVLVQQKPIIHSDINGLSGGLRYNNCSPHTGTGRVGIPTGKASTEHAAVPSQVFGMVSTSTSTLCPMPGNDCSLNKAKLSETWNGLLQSGDSSALGSNLDSQTFLNAGVDGKPSWHRVSSSYHQEQFFQFPPDLNVGFLAPNSPSSSVPIGSPQQPDLALQL
ncbi:uncharacterized protein LOC8273622 isoform X3 [Ricinus communis]|uniref:uncharacterized protein LOC8273622 isoform X3 n=1 Tax=Ricinus communis TaxID=3988 RepID=UPI00201A7BB6|nr:uncharacterized protein LOC8273622 isoform X3 [Ricinus communis]